MTHRIVTAILLLALLVTVGCKPTVRPDETVKNFLDAMINSDFESASGFTGGVNPEYELERILRSQGDMFGSEQDEILRLVLARVTYELGDEDVQGEKANVRVRISAPDCQSISREALQTLLLMQSIKYTWDTTPMYCQYFGDEVVRSGAPRAVSNVIVALEKKDGVWMVQLRGNDALLNGLTGDMANVLGL